MKIIHSRQNPLYREWRQIAESAQARRKKNRTLLEGIHLCQAYLEQGHQPLCCLFSETALTSDEAALVVSQCESSGIACVRLSDALYEGLSQVEHGTGILFVIEPPIWALPEQLDETAVLLDRIQDPGNMGSILRSAAAAGINHVFVSPGSSGVWTPRVLRAGMGAHFAVRVYENADLPACIARYDLPVAATLPNAEKNIYEADLKPALFWLFGHEGQGVSASLQALSHFRLSIPQQGRVESLNVAACAAICFFEQLRQISHSHPALEA